MEALHHVRERRFSKFMSGVSGYSSLCLIPDSKLSLLISAQMFTYTTVIIGYAIKCHPCRNKVTNTHARKPCPFWLAFWVTWGGQGEKCSLQFSSIKHKNPNYCIYSKKASRELSRREVLFVCSRPGLSCWWIGWTRANPRARNSPWAKCEENSSERVSFGVFFCSIFQ